MLLPDQAEGTAFVNCTRAALVDGTVAILPSTRTVVEILESVEPDPQLLESCAALKARGYRFALDDFTPSPSRAPLIELAEFIKIDFLSCRAKKRREIYAMAAGSPITFLAEKIETREEMQIALDEGCTLFQGYFFSRPTIISSRTLPQNRIAYLRLLTALHRTPANLKEVEGLIMSDPSLCYRVLRLANSVTHGLASEITSVRAALLLLGEVTVRRMVSVAAASSLAGSLSTPLLAMALTRARFCELLAPQFALPPAELHLLGMLSLLDVLLETPIDRILEELPISPAMKGALSGQPGSLRSALDLASCLESCNWSRCEALANSAGLTEKFVSDSWLEAVHWASSSLSV
jgi:c-di-GMP-related signal transduction protein